jgi:hypothetical protein
MAQDMAHGSTSSEDIISELLTFIARPAISDEEFNQMALRVFARQVALNLPYQRFCQLRGKTPRLVKNWRDIPAVPIDAFKEFTLSCVPAEECDRVFMTSGTTRGEVKGRHHHPSMAVYDASMLRHFSEHVMQADARLPMGILFPTEIQMPNSSLAHYLAFALLGASYSFVHLLDELQTRGLSFVLPKGSRILDTGGFKGQSRDIPIDAFYAQLSATFGVDRRQCINMYGMTELSTQFYDAGNHSVPSVKRGPHWLRSRLLDPMTGQELAKGERGILAHTDLANVNSVTTILTEDVGVATDDGFILLGRAQGAQAKGCSLAVEDFLKAARG